MKKKKNAYTIAVANVLFNGLGFRNLLDWGITHIIVVFLKIGWYAKWRVHRHNDNPIKKLVDLHSPDFLIVKEFMPTIDQIIRKYLEAKGYYIFEGKAPDRKGLRAMSVLIASKIPGEQIDFVLPEKSGGGACGVYFKELNLMILSPHPSAFHRYSRAKQIGYTAKVAKLCQHGKKNVIIAGDMNCDGSELSQHLAPLQLRHITSLTFPHPELMKGLLNIWWLWLNRLLFLNNGMRSLDHIFVPPYWKVLHSGTVDIRSDHLALVTKIEI